MTHTYATVRSAIAEKRHVIARYNGFVREMCPHVIGTKNGREQALFYQFGGSSSSGLSPIGSPSNWRCIPLQTIEIIEIRDGEWYTAHNHSRPQTCVDDIDLEVSF